MPLMMLMMNGTTLAVVWFGGRQIIVGNMQVGDLTAFTTYIVQIPDVLNDAGYGHPAKLKSTGILKPYP